MVRLYARALCQVVWSHLHLLPHRPIPSPVPVHHSYYLLRTRCRDRVLRCRRRELRVYPIQYPRARARNRWMGNANEIVLSYRPLCPLHLPRRRRLRRDLEWHSLHPRYRRLMHMLPIGSRYPRIQRCRRPRKDRGQDHRSHLRACRLSLVKVRKCWGA